VIQQSELLAMLEFRLDPNDGKAYTFVQVAKCSEGQYTREEIDAYWDDMVPVSGRKFLSASGNQAPFSINLSVLFNDRTLGVFQQLDFDPPWQDILRNFKFKCLRPPMTGEFLATCIESIVEANYIEYKEGKDTLQAQTQSMWRSGRSQLMADEELPFEDDISKYLKSGDTVIVELFGMADSTMKKPAEFTEADLEKVRASLNFGLNDRVLCNCGPRWLVGRVVGTAVPDDDELLPYLVKTDPSPGLPSNTISVPEDNNDDVCTQEVCFDPISEMHLIQAAAALVSETNRPKLRFAVGNKVRCRVRNSPNDGLEQWLPGEITAAWPKLSGEEVEETWDMGGITGEFPDVVPYRVDLVDGRWIYCHRDDHTLIRREGFQPLARVRGISKRIEVRNAEDGRKEQIDHVTERRKTLANELSDSD
jgi:hypothetical protein